MRKYNRQGISINRIPEMNQDACLDILVRELGEEEGQGRECVRGVKNMHAGLTAANFVAVISAIIVAVTLVDRWDAVSVRAGELVRETSR